MRSRAAASVVLILGTVFVIFGIARSNPALWIAGAIVLAITIKAHLGSEKPNS